MGPEAAGIGIVVIGRNEGDRLTRCLNSLSLHRLPIVYVDSGSTDGSVENAGRVTALTVSLDAAAPFTAARARNAGFARLLAHAPGIEFVQFVDGDCLLDKGWLEQAAAFMKHRPETAACFGRRREASPEASIYNRLCDMEWSVPPGEAASCGGDALFRADAFRSHGGFDARLIAGEEPELCFRLRRAGFRIQCLDLEMTRHDASITALSPYLKRLERGGYAYTKSFLTHFPERDGYRLRETVRVLAWGLLLPLALAAAAAATNELALVGFSLYPAQIARVFLKTRRNSRANVSANFYYSLSCVLGKFPEAWGAIRCLIAAALHRREALIEYK